MTRHALLHDGRMFGELLGAPIIVDSATGQVVDFKFKTEVDNKLARTPSLGLTLAGCSGARPTISDYLQGFFPPLKIYPKKYIATSGDPATGIYDFRTLAVHYSINSVFVYPGEHDSGFLSFLGFAIVIHGLGHTFRSLCAREVIPGHAHRSVHYETSPRSMFFSENKPFSALALPAGFAAEIGILWGVIGAVLDNEVDG
ncbi:hypothetical protein FB451DRAFT_1397602 [Mycena latifolia]|nr:hypothetical protein FB451DRAFT_1397602 [Mycena latifolia]